MSTMSQWSTTGTSPTAAMPFSNDLRRLGSRKSRRAARPARTLPCPLCPPSAKLFKNEVGLQAHLNSRYHDSEKDTRTGGIVPTGNLTPASNIANVAPGSEDEDDPAVHESIAKIQAAIKGISIVPINDELIDDDYIYPEALTTQMLFLCHTREHALHIGELLSKIGKPMGITTCVCIGGTNLREAINAVSENPHIVVGCMGRVADLIRRRKLKTKDIEVLCLNMDAVFLRKNNHVQLHEVYRWLEPETRILRTNVDVDIEVLGEALGSLRVSEMPTAL